MPGTKILVFYPDGRRVGHPEVCRWSTQAGDNVAVSAVRGNFDDAQTGVKQIFGDKRVCRRAARSAAAFLSSANSINWGRLLPQIVYYFSAYCDAVTGGEIAMGDEAELLSCRPATSATSWPAGMPSEMGLPVGKLICASNANNVLTDFIRTGTYDRNRPFHTTASPSMDILVSSNLERLLYALCGSDAEVAGYMQQLREQGSYTVSDALKAKIQAAFAGGFCNDIPRRAEDRPCLARPPLPDRHAHGGRLYHVLDEYRRETGDATPSAVVVSTASPFKFCDQVLRGIGGTADAFGPALIRTPVVRDADRRARAADRPRRAPGALRRLCGSSDADAAHGGRIPEITKEYVTDGETRPAGSENAARPFLVKVLQNVSSLQEQVPCVFLT